jgi:hypothetical protein
VNPNRPSVDLLSTELVRKPCKPPVDVGDKSEIGYEEAATVWLWAWPELLGWSSDITWLFSPVTGKAKWPGDAWGLDKIGNLLIVEAKIAKAGKASDPFEDFVDFTPGTVEELHQRWSRGYLAERKFISEHLDPLRAGTLAVRRYPGCVPNSRQRREVRRWPAFYIEHIAPTIESPEYQESVAAAIEAYKRRRAVEYIGLFMLQPGGRARLSGKGKMHYEQLTSQVGAQKLHMFALEARQRESSWEIQSYRLHLPD